MRPERWQQIEPLYHAALERAPDERAAYLAQVCAGDAELCGELESLLAFDEQTAHFITSPPDAMAAEMFAEEATKQMAEPFAHEAAGAPTDLPSGQVLRNFRLLHKIGQGGMGEVYAAEDLKLGRHVALKLLPMQTMPDAQARQRFLREARAASALNHPNIVTIHAIEEAEGRDFIVMEQVEGETLKASLARGPLALAQLLSFGSQVAEAIAAAHAIGLIHRDLKPANLMLTSQGQAKVLDFGLAKKAWPLLHARNSEDTTLGSALTNPGMIVGTVAYMSPEQTRGEPLDARSDIFSLGVVLYEAATGRAPFTGPSLQALMHAIATFDPPPPATVNQSLPREFDRIIARTMAKDKEQRYNSAAELSAALQALPRTAQHDFAADAEPSQGESGVFVGREPEVKQLAEFLRQAVAGAGRVVFLTGEPGIGKTTLADEFLRRARQQQASLICGRGRCVEQYGTGEAYLSFLDALGALLVGPRRERITAILLTYAPTWCLQFPAVFPSSGAREQLQRETIGATKERMLRELGDALAALAAESPVVLLLEDLHWADPSSTDLLRHLCQRIGDQRVLIVGTFRPADLELSKHPLRNYLREMRAHKLCDEMALGLLTEQQLTSYLAARFTPHDFPSELATLIQRKTEGHPLFATSLVQFLVERGDIAQTNAHWTLARPLAELALEAPETVRGLLQKKLESLAEEDRRTMLYASIEGEEFLSTVLAQLLGVDELELEERLDRLVRTHRLVARLGEEELPDGALAMRYGFAHILYQNVLYGDLVSKRRILLHRQAGEQLLAHYGEQSSRIAAQLALHFERGRDFTRAVQHLRQAGENAAAIFANGEAEQHYSRALSLVERLPLTEQPDASLTLYQKRGTVNLALSRLEAALSDFHQMLEQAQAAHLPDLECAALILIANTLFWDHRLDEMRRYAEEAVRTAERAGSETLRLEALVSVAQRHYAVGELAEAKPLLDEVIRIATALQHKPALLSGLTYRGFIHFFQTEYERAETALSEVRTLALELRHGFLLLASSFFLGLTRGNQGRMSEALTTLQEALERARRSDASLFYVRLPNSIGWVYRELGDFERAFALDQESITGARKYGVVEAEANALINLGHGYTHNRADTKAFAALCDVEGIYERNEVMRWRYYGLRLPAGMAEHWLAQGNFAQAEEQVRTLLENATRHGVPKYVAVAHKLRAEIAIAQGNLAVAETALQAALEQLQDHPAPLVAWKLYAARGRLYLQIGQPQAARVAFAQAATIINSIATSVDDEKLRETFLSSTAVQEVKAGLAPLEA